jgi:hypothetical protein
MNLSVKTLHNENRKECKILYGLQSCDTTWYGIWPYSSVEQHAKLQTINKQHASRGVGITYSGFNIL